jgi:hypothetical protein
MGKSINLVWGFLGIVAASLWNVGRNVGGISVSRCRGDFVRDVASSMAGEVSLLSLVVAHGLRARLTAKIVTEMTANRS